MTYLKIIWIVVLTIFFIEVIWLSFSSISINYSLDIIYIFFITIFILYSSYILLKRFHFERVNAILLSLCWILAFNNCGLILSYLLNTINRPLISSSLADIDHYLGFYAPALVHWFWNHHGLDIIFRYIYASLTSQQFFILFYLGGLGKVNYLESYIMQYMIAGVLTAVIGGLFPAVGTHEWYGFAASPGQLSDLERLYELRQNIVALGKFNGIVEFPSFHTTAGVLLIYAFRHESKFIFIPILILNILMIFSCMSHGGHFLIDIIGGIAVAAIAIGFERTIFKKIHSFSFKSKKNMKEKTPPITDFAKR
ncbi:MAG: phosphatase PAP2 family protein [Alphaproteobacteria bacterium]|nr:phosphatase PAP2 family protein [Alphaproteobacteria bacterium]